AGTWEIQKWAPGDKGEVVLDGTYDTHGDGEDRQPEQDVYRLPNGHYKLFWDGDLDTHKHDKMKVFWVDCPTTQPTSQPTPVAASAPPSQAPSESAPGGVGGPSGPPSATPPGGGVGGPSGPPSATPSGSELAVGGVSGPSSPPTGEVQGIVGTPAATLPSTDTIGTASAANDTGWRLSVMIFAAVVALLAMLVPAPKRLT